MVRVAVAGGLGDVGGTIVEEIARQEDHEVCVLTRKGLASKNVAASFATVVIIAVDYGNILELREVLRWKNITTVISALNLHWPGAAESQVNLIRAAAGCGVVEQFVLSEFNIDYGSLQDLATIVVCIYEIKERNTNTTSDTPYPLRILFLQAAQELERHTILKYTLVRNGFFMDYLGLPWAETYLHPLYCILDLPERKATIPDNGTEYVIFTHTRDVASVLNELLKLPGDQWPRESVIIGQKTRLNELVKLAERVAEQSFGMSYDSVETLRNGVTTELPSNKSCYAYFPDGKSELGTIISTMMIGMANGVFDVKGTVLNDLFPHVKPLGLEAFPRQCWDKSR